ncbi:MAG: class I SAM-dependent methyltransferase [archaeon]
MQNSFYDSQRAQLREDYFRDNSKSSAGGDLFFKIINSELPEGSRILDIGTGNAFVLNQLSNQGYSLNGVDISPEMLKKARESAQRNNLQLAVGDNFALPFQSDSFDAVTAKNVTNFSAPEVYRVLKNTGKFFFREYGPGKGLKEIADLFPGRLVRSRDPPFYIRGLESAGFRKISLTRLDLTREYSQGSLLSVIQMFPFLDSLNPEDISMIESYFGESETKKITSDQIIIIGEK